MGDPSSVSRVDGPATRRRTRTFLDQPVGVRLTGLVAAGVLALGTCVGVMTVENHQVSSLSQDLSRLNAANAVVLKLDRAAADLKATALRAVIRTNSQQEQATLDRQLTATADLLAELKRADLPPRERDSVQRIVTAFTDYGTVVKRFIDGAAADPGTARAGWEQVGVDNYLTGAVTANERTFFDRSIAQDEQAVAARRSEETTAVVITVLVALAVLTLLARVIVRSITRPLLRVRATLAAVADGDLTVSTGIHARDEVGQMAGALDRALAGLRRTISAVADSAAQMAASSGQLDTVSSELTTSSHAATVQSAEVSQSAREISGAAGSMTTATEEMNASIGEISQQALSASQVAAEAVQTVAETSRAVEALDAASQEIGEIIRTITSIAEQTNLLALNATIEAARAGVAGAGFAVVASEVKELARETAQATDDITDKISAIQNTTQAAISSIGQISSVIRQINEKQSTIASAVEEQTAVTQQMGTSVAEISSRSAQVATTIGDISTGTEHTTRAATTTAESATRLAQLSSTMHTLLAQFRY